MGKRLRKGPGFDQVIYLLIVPMTNNKTQIFQTKNILELKIYDQSFELTPRSLIHL